jgi:GNAT superfamily N-acetyltransferase
MCEAEATAATGRVAVRPAGPDDDLDILNDGNTVWSGAQVTRDAFAAGGTAPMGMVVGELDGRPVGYSHAVGAPITSGFRGMGHVYVLPSFRGRGVGTALWRAVLGVCSVDRVPGVGAQIDADDAVSGQIVTDHGGTLARLHIQSELDLDALDPATVKVRTRLGDDVELALLPNDTDESRWQQFADLFFRLSRDTPDWGEGSEDMPYEVLRSMVAKPWQVMIAWDGERMIGFTAVFVRDGDRRTLNTLLTAVDGDYRGHGVATAMKSAHALELRDRNWKVLVTQNMEGNEPILASNRRLGFRASRRIRDVTYDNPGPAAPADSPIP